VRPVQPLSGVIFNIQRFSIHDGPGIRTTVFFKGCSLRCFWCHNPEGLATNPEIQFFPDRCIQCGECVLACPHGAQQSTASIRLYDRERCVVCGECLDTCFTGALELTGSQYTVAQVVAEAERDRIFYTESGGGVTLSGGDPLLQATFTSAVLQALKASGLHTALETAANCRWDILAGLLPSTDLVMLDIKHMDPARHRAATGVSNRRILANAARLAEMGVPLIFRTPVVPGVNDTSEAIGAIAAFIHQITESGKKNGHYQESPPTYELLPFHQLAAGKYHSLGLEYRPASLQPPSREHMQHLAEAAAEGGIVAIAR
jgi:pyruvate formate lyase activating enzyme